MYFESHAHYDDKSFDDDRNELLKALPQHEIEFVINSAASIKSSFSCIELSKKYPYFFASVGVHPQETENISENDIKTLKELSKNEKVVAIGEIGLDFHFETPERDIQRKWFIRQLELAKETDLPVIIHSRDASEECFNIIKESKVKKGVIHCYSGSTEMALDYIAMGFYIGVGGVVTYKNAKKLVEVVKTIPLEKILIETDSPYLSPEPKRRTRNDSTNLKFVTEKIAEIKNIEPSEVQFVTNVNGKNLFFK